MGAFHPNGGRRLKHYRTHIHDGFVWTKTHFLHKKIDDDFFETTLVGSEWLASVDSDNRKCSAG